MEFENKIVVITGAGSGIGKLLSTQFLSEGAKVMMIDINNKILAEINDDNLETYVVDLRDYDQIDKCIKLIISKHGHIDYLINSAGGNPGRICKDEKPFNELKISTIDWGVEVNFRAPMYMARAVINNMIENKFGVIINISSISGYTGSSTACDYSAEKSGLVGLTKSIALLGAPYNIRCCCITPGPVLTRAEMANMTTPLGRAAKTKEITDLIMYLCSDKASFITGSNYLIDGGRSLGGMKHAK